MGLAPDPMRQLPQLREGWSLPVAPTEARRLGLNADVIEDPEGGVVLLAGTPAWYWSDGDLLGRRLAAVQAVTTGAAPATAGGFGVRPAALSLWRRAYERGRCRGRWASDPRVRWARRS